MERRFVMKWIGSLIIITLTSVLLLSGITFAQRGLGRAGGRQGYRAYNPKTVETLSGEVTKIENITSRRSGFFGIHVLLKTDAEEISVHLGPSWYLDKQEVQIHTGDKIEVTGSRITFDNKPAILAATVKKGDLVLKLRDENGFPLWSRSQIRTQK